MENLNINIGLKHFQLVDGGAPLVFNPQDQNIYSRFHSVIGKMQKIEQTAKEEAQKIAEDAEDRSTQVLLIFENADKRMKEALNDVFGGNNDFDKILCGVNLLAINEDGKRVVEALLNALAPIFKAGVESYVNSELEAAKKNRENRYAL